MVDWEASLLALTPFLVIVGIAVHLGFRFVRAFERRGQSQSALVYLTDRVQQLEDAVATLSTEVHHINEAEQFNGRLLEERKSGSVPPARKGVD